MRDETDLSGLKLTIDLKRGTDPDALMSRRYRLTPLQESAACNFNILIEGSPRVMGVREILEEWTAWRTGCVRRRVYYTMKKKQEKLHLLKGLQKILLDIDRAIQIIRNTEEDAEVVPNLMIGFGIDQVQAEFVADIKLRNINKEYILKRTQETSALESEIADLQDTVNKPQRIRNILISELGDVRKKYAAPRRTEILYQQELENEPDPFQEAPDYPVNLFLSREGYLKKITSQSLRMSGEQKYKEGDGPYLGWEPTTGTSFWCLPTGSSVTRRGCPSSTTPRPASWAITCPPGWAWTAGSRSNGRASPATTPPISSFSSKTARPPGWS
jgi:DNA gyrase subunit A